MNASTPRDLHPIEAALLEQAATMTSRPSPRSVDPLTAATLLEAEVTSRVVDHTARWLRAEHGVGYYTIGSAGHEANAAIALSLRPDDPALLHYRSGGFYMARSMQSRQRGVASGDPVVEVLRGMLAKSTDQIAGGRHKVFGNAALSIIPQTSTIASHLPRSVGLAISLGLGRGGPRSDARVPHRWPEDAVVVCSFGDASLNHSTAQGALNWAGHTAASGQRVPVVFVCEDNRIGLSVDTPPGWVAASVAQRAGVLHTHVDGFDPATTIGRVTQLVDDVRSSGRPGFVHLDTVRFLGHAGTDVESAYRSPAELASDRARDPILGALQLAVDLEVCTGAEFVDWYLDLRATIRETALDLRSEPELLTSDEVIAPLRPVRRSLPTPTGAPLGDGAPLPAPSEAHESSIDETEPLTLARTINRALAELLDADPAALVFGEDVARKGGVYGVTRGLQQQAGRDRVFDTLLDEQSVLGLALGAGLNGFLPIPEIQYLAYLHNAEDQIRGEAATQAFFSNRQYLNPMVVRIASYAYQKGFGGHFHNDNSIAVLRDIPGLVIASPSHPSDAAGMLNGCIDLAKSTGAVCVSLEPIARYHDADLHAPGDGRWMAPYDPTPIAPGSTRTWRNDRPAQLTILTWGNGLHLSLRAQRELVVAHHIDVAVVDLRWLAPLPIDEMVIAAESTGRVLVVDETRRSGGVGEGIVAELVDAGFRGPIRRVAAEDSFVPLGAAAELVLVGVDDIVHAVRDIVR